MSELNGLLTKGDPLRDEAPPSDLAIQRMRFTVMASADRPVPAAVSWARMVLTTATVAAVLTGLAVLLRQPPRTSPNAIPVVEASTVRQLHFSTPGGTRVIWVFNPEFK